MRLAFIAICVSLSYPAFADEEKSPTERIRAFQVTQAFDCQNVSCKRLHSCAEACYKLIQCGQSVRDGDHDGIPCENLCSRRC